MRRLVRCLVATVLVAVAVPARPVAAQAPITLTVMQQTPAVALGGELELRLRVQGPVGADDDYEIQVVAHPALGSLDELDETLRTDDIEGFKDSVEVPLASLDRFADGDVGLTIELNDLDESDFDFRKLNLSRPGVYPIEIVVRDADEAPLAQVISWLVVTEPDAAPTVRLAAIWSLLPPLAVERDGVTPTAELVAAAGEGGLLEAFVDRIEATDLPISLELSPAAIDAWARAADLDPDAAASFERLRAALAGGRFDLLPQPYAPIDGPDVEAAELGSRVPDSFVEGAQVLQDRLGIRPGTAIVHAERTDPAAAERLGATFAYRIVVDPAAVDPTPPAGAFTLVAGERRFEATAVRHDLARLVGAEGPVAGETDARRLALLYARLALEQGTGDGGVLGVVLGDDLDRGLVRRLQATLADQTLVEFAPLAAAFEKPRDATAHRLRPVTTRPDLVSPLEVLDVEQRLAAFVGFVGEEHPAVLAAEANLRLALSRDVSATEQRNRLGDLGIAIGQFTSGISAESKRVTLTDRRSEVPFSFRNDTEREVEVRVRLSSPKLTFPEGPERVIVLPPGRVTQEAFLVEARTSGTFPMELSITSVDGALAVSGPTRITVQSAVFGSVGTWLTFGALGFLALWWAHHFWRTRRRAAAPSA